MQRFLPDVERTRFRAGWLFVAVGGLAAADVARSVRGGGVRAAEDLDKPLHERVRGSAQATDPAPLRAEWHVRLLGLGGLVLVVVLFQVGRAVRDALFPGVVRVTPGGVSYRGRRLAFADIEEITTGEAVEIAGDRGRLRLPASFCPAEGMGAVAAELERLIVAVAHTAPRRV
jgi:hypothetical protein